MLGLSYLILKNISSQKWLKHKALRDFSLYLSTLYHDSKFRFIYSFLNLVKK